MNEKLQTKDLINVGMFTALYFVCFFGVGMLGYIPVLMVLVPLFCPIVAGIPFMLYLTKVKKFGMVTITGIILGILMLFTGHPWPVLVSGMVFGLLGDLVMKSGKYSDWKKLTIGYAVFSEWILGGVAAMFFMRESYFATIRAGYGDTYTDALLSLTPMWVFYAMIFMIIVGSIMGAFLGKKVLKKHFRKAGIA